MELGLAGVGAGRAGEIAGPVMVVFAEGGTATGVVLVDEGAGATVELPEGWGFCTGDGETVLLLGFKDTIIGAAGDDAERE